MTTSNIKAFSLVELMVTTLVMGLLVSLSLSLYDEYKARANDLIALNQLVNARTALETIIADGSYTVITIEYEADGIVYVTYGPTEGLPGFVQEPDVSIRACSGADVSNSYNILTSHEKGSKKWVSAGRSSGMKNKFFSYDSQLGEVESYYPGGPSTVGGCIKPVVLIP